MKIFVISLARSVDRRAQMLDKLTKAEVEFEFFDAVDASIEGFYLSDRVAPDITKKRKGYELLKSEVACYASHFSLWEKCVAINEPIVILEDHAELTTDFKETLATVFHHANDFGYIKLSAPIKPRKFIEDKKINISHAIGHYSKNTCFTTGYIITPDTAKLFVETSDRILEPVDDFMEKPWLHHVKAYSLAPFICYRAKIKSTIGSARKNKVNIGIYQKIYIEFFRWYEKVLRCLN
ncbi:MAG: glycosyltransferase family 25 protein [Shewanella sp.]